MTKQRAWMQCFFLLVVFAVALVGCGESDDTPPVAPISTNTPTSTLTATATVTFTSTSSPTPTVPFSPTVTATSIPTASSTPTLTVTPTVGPPQPLTIMTFNVLCSFCDTMHEYDPWTARLDEFADTFARHDPDLMGLQEISPPPINGGKEPDQILAHAPGYQAIYFKPSSGPYAPYPDAMILYRSSRFTVLESGQYWLSPTPDTPWSTGFARPQFPRLVVWTRLRDHGHGDREIYFASTHFDNNAPSQQLSAPLVQDRTAPFVVQEPVIVVGDFNSRPDSTAYQILTTDSSHGFVFQNTFDLTQFRIVTNQSPEPAYDVNDRIDHIFLAGSGVTWTVTDWLADLTVYGAQQRYPSDHFPVVAVVDY